MKTVFADTHYWYAIANPRDQWHEAAKAAKAGIGDVRLVTTDEVLNEFLAMMSGRGPELRETAVKMIRAIMDNSNIKVVQQSRDSFRQALELYADRSDKSYSLTDCASMNAMKASSLREILTNDHHFEQEGFVVLIKLTKA